MSKVLNREKKTMMTTSHSLLHVKEVKQSIFVCDENSVVSPPLPVCLADEIPNSPSFGAMLVKLGHSPLQESTEDSRTLR